MFCFRNYSVCLFAILFLMAAPAHAEITEIQRLNFGRWVITNNSSQHAITVDINGSVSASSNALIMLEAPEPGMYRVTDLPAFTSIGSVNVTMTQPMGGGGAAFILDDFQTAIPATNADGETTLTLGATAKTSGNNQSYQDTTHSGELLIEINL
jgi:hypothetical protein